MRAAPLFLVLAAGCSGEGSATVPAGREAWFVESSEDAGIAFSWRSGSDGERLFFPEIMGGGVALFDADADGDVDVYLVQGGDVRAGRAAQPGNALFLNRGDGTFEDASAGCGAEDRGFGMGVALGDYDDDGLEDLYVTNVGPNALLRNLGGGRFEDVTASAGVAGDLWSASAGFFDFDRDGDLDLFVTNYIHWSAESELECFSKLQGSDYCSPKSYNAPAPDVLYRNEGDGRFVDVSVEMGLRTAFGNGLGLVVSDFDGDGFEDVFVANDGVKNQLWINQRGRSFLDQATALGCAVDQDGREKAGMGTSAIDVDDDGDEDLLVVNLTGEPDSFFRNDGGRFLDKTPLVGLSGVSRPYTRFGMGFADFDQDGCADLYQANGRVTRAPDIPGAATFDQENLLFRGTAKGRFDEVLPRGGVATALSATSRAAAFGDLDGDGAVDTIVVNRDAPAHVLLNRVPERGHWIALRVRERSGRAALGAVVTLRLGGRTVTRRVRSAYSYCAANDPVVHVGLGEASAISSAVVTWVGGERTDLGALEVDTLHDVRRR